MKRYDNGELVTQNRIQDEEWYGTYYQPFLQYFVGRINNIDEMYEETINFFKNEFGEELSETNKERILRWCVLHVERSGGQREEDISNEIFDDLMTNFTSKFKKKEEYEKNIYDFCLTKYGRIPNNIQEFINESFKS